MAGSGCRLAGVRDLLDDCRLMWLVRSNLIDGVRCVLWPLTHKRQNAEIKQKVESAIRDAQAIYR